MKRPEIKSVKDKIFLYLGLFFIVVGAITFIASLIYGFSPIVSGKPFGLGLVICLFYLIAKARL
jgi:hypothetical protein